MTKILLEVKSLKKTYEHKNGIIKLFDNVNIKIKKGELIALTGPSGSGKSSFLHMLALLDSPTKGKIFIKDKDTKDLKEFEKDNIRRKNISIIFQDNNLLTDFTVIENVIMPLIIKGESLKSAKEKAMKIPEKHFPRSRRCQACSPSSHTSQPNIILTTIIISTCSTYPYCTSSHT